MNTTQSNFNEWSTCSIRNWNDFNIKPWSGKFFNEINMWLFPYILCIFKLVFSCLKWTIFFGGLSSPTFIVKMFKHTEKLKDCPVNTPVPTHLDSVTHAVFLAAFQLLTPLSPILSDTFQRKLQTLVHSSSNTSACVSLTTVLHLFMILFVFFWGKIYIQWNVEIFNCCLIISFDKYKHFWKENFYQHIDYYHHSEIFFIILLSQSPPLSKGYDSYFFSSRSVLRLESNSMYSLLKASQHVFKIHPRCCMYHCSFLFLRSVSVHE